MGLLFSSSKETKKIVILGLDNSGKSTFLYKLSTGHHVNTLPTIGFNIEKFSYNNYNLILWDIGGQSRLIPLWEHYLHDTDYLIWIIDSSDRERVGQSLEELVKIINRMNAPPAIINKFPPLLIYCNKQDMEGSFTPKEIFQKYGCYSFLKSIKYYRFQSLTATTGDGMLEGVDWLFNCTEKNNNSGSLINILKNYFK